MITQQQAREALRKRIMDAMEPLATQHDFWPGWPGTWHFAEAAINAIDAQHPDAPSADYVIVPKVPTREMLLAGREAEIHYEAAQRVTEGVYRAMLAAAPPSTLHAELVALADNWGRQAGVNIGPEGNMLRKRANELRAIIAKHFGDSK